MGAASRRPSDAFMTSAFAFMRTHEQKDCVEFNKYCEDRIKRGDCRPHAEYGLHGSFVKDARWYYQAYPEFWHGFVAERVAQRLKGGK